MEIKEINIENIYPYELNAKAHPESQIKNVMESIKQFGWQQPLVLDKDGIIIIGHCRYEAGKRLGYQTLPCVVADLSDYQARRLRLLDNKLNESEWDFEALKLELDSGFNDLDFSEFDIDWGIPEEDTADEVVEDNYNVDENIPENPKSKTGDIFLLGEHKLLCGDSTSSYDVARLMDGKEADLIFTDPPYNVNVENSQGMKIENDNMDTKQFREFLSSAFKCMSESVKDGGAFYVWHADSETVNFRETLEENNLTVKQCLIWVKNGFNFGRQDYKWKHEPCLYGWKAGAGHYFVEEYNHPTVIEDEVDTSKMKKEELKAMLDEILAMKVPTTIIHENKPLKNDLHPTMKPLKMCAELIRNSSKKGEIVLDLFGGSGSTMMACEQLSRKCYSMEIDPVYTDVIIDRYIKLTGKEVYRLNEDGTTTKWEEC